MLAVEISCNVLDEKMAGVWWLIAGRCTFRCVPLRLFWMLIPSLLPYRFTTMLSASYPLLLRLIPSPVATPLRNVQISVC